MEKRVAHYDLHALKVVVSTSGAAAFTRMALREIDMMGLTFAEAVGVVLDLQRGMLHKSMTTHADHRVWQDVYHAPCPNGEDGVYQADAARWRSGDSIQGEIACANRLTVSTATTAHC